MISSAVLGAGCVIFKRDKVLLVKHKAKSAISLGLYGAPCGRVNPQEAIEEAAVREVFEETGLRVRLLKRVSQIYFAKVPLKNRTLRPSAMILYLAKIVGGRLRETEETKPFWVEIEKLSTLNLLPNTEKAVKRAFSEKPLSSS